MCMAPARTDNLESVSKKAYKTLQWDKVNKNWITPFMENKVINNKIKAEGLPRFQIDDFYDRILHGGAIHCYKEKDAFWKIQGPCYAYEKDFLVQGKNVIAYNDNEVAFDEIEFLDPLDPPTQIEIEEHEKSMS